MTKRAIYLDPRERKLMRVCLRFCARRIEHARDNSQLYSRDITETSLYWMEADIKDIIEHFEEPELGRQSVDRAKGSDE